MVLIGIGILVLAMALVYVSGLAHTDNNGQISIFALMMGIIVTGVSVAIIMHESYKTEAINIKAEVLQHLNSNKSVTLTLEDKVFTYQLNDSTMVDLFEYLTEEDDTNE